MRQLNTIIVDDEQDSIDLLRLQLHRHCPEVEVPRCYNNPMQALQDILSIPPDLLFIDVEMPGMNGFELLEQVQPLNFSVVFVTAFNQYAIRAFRFNALDYLLKPTDPEELKTAVTRATQKHWPTQGQLIEASTNVKGTFPTRIALPTQNGVNFIALTDILYAEASNNYSKIILTDGSTHLLSKTLKDVQNLLEESHFLRVHRQYIVNLNNVKHFNRNEGILTMDTKVQLPIVRNQYDRFLEKYYKF